MLDELIVYPILRERIDKSIVGKLINAEIKYKEKYLVCLKDSIELLRKKV